MKFRVFRARFAFDVRCHSNCRYARKSASICPQKLSLRRVACGSNRKRPRARIDCLLVPWYELWWWWPEKYQYISQSIRDFIRIWQKLHDLDSFDAELLNYYYYWSLWWKILVSCLNYLFNISKLPTDNVSESKLTSKKLILMIISNRSYSIRCFLRPYFNCQAMTVITVLFITNLFLHLLL